MKEQFFDRVTFFADVDEALYARRIKLSDFHAVLNVARVTVWRWRRGRAEMPVNAFLMLCCVLKLDAGSYYKLNAEARELKSIIDEDYPERG